MKRNSLLPFFTVALLATAFSIQPCHAGRDAKYQDDTVASPDGTSVVDPAEEAHKIRRLVKLALANNATAASRQVLDEEIAFVEKNKKLKENVVLNLLQDDNPDPTLPKVALVKYKDGSNRGLLFIQTDDVHSSNPNRLAWPLDAKRESKEESR
jgi:hypothetical protein